MKCRRTQCRSPENEIRTSADEVEYHLSQLHQFEEDRAGGPTDWAREGRSLFQHEVSGIGMCSVFQRPLRAGKTQTERL